MTATALVTTMPRKSHNFSIESLIGRSDDKDKPDSAPPSPRLEKPASPEMENRCSVWSGADLKHLFSSFSGHSDSSVFQPLRVCNRVLPGLNSSPLMAHQFSAIPFNPLVYGLNRDISHPHHPWIHPRYPSFVHPRYPVGPPPGLLFHPYRKPKRNRTAFSPNQLLQLEQSFETNHYVVGQERKQLASKLQLTETQVKVWFQNRRTKHKRMKAEEEAGVTSQHGDEYSACARDGESHTARAEGDDRSDGAETDNEEDRCSSDEDEDVSVDEDP